MLAVMKTFVTDISASTGRNDFIFDMWLWYGDLYRVSPFQEGDYTQLINRSFAHKAKEGRRVRINSNSAIFQLYHDENKLNKMLHATLC
jgi:hypothetical protein